MNAQREDLLVHSNFANFIVRNGLIKLCLSLLSFKMAPLTMLVN